MVILNEIVGDAERLEPGLMVRFHEETAGVLEYGWAKLVNARKRSVNPLHVQIPLDGGSAAAWQRHCEETAARILNPSLDKNHCPAF